VRILNRGPNLFLPHHGGHRPCCIRDQQILVNQVNFVTLCHALFVDKFLELRRLAANLILHYQDRVIKDAEGQKDWTKELRKRNILSSLKGIDARKNSVVARECLHQMNSTANENSGAAFDLISFHPLSESKDDSDICDARKPVISLQQANVTAGHFWEGENSDGTLSPSVAQPELGGNQCTWMFTPSTPSKLDEQLHPELFQVHMVDSSTLLYHTIPSVGMQ
jgi:hypothetical protein